MLYSEFRSKEVINICDCKKLGRVVDFEMDECKGQICKLIVSKGGKLCCLFTAEEELTIPYGDIRQIGPDIILVEIAGSKCKNR